MQLSADERALTLRQFQATQRGATFLVVDTEDDDTEIVRFSCFPSN